MIVLIYNNHQLFFQKLMNEIVKSKINFNLIEPETLTKNILFNLFKEEKIFTENTQKEKNEIYIKRKIFKLNDLKEKLYFEIKNINFNFFINYLIKNLEEQADLYILVSNDIDIIKYMQKFYSEELFIIKIIDENSKENGIIADTIINIHKNEINPKEYQKMLEIIEYIINNSKKLLLENKTKNFLPNNRKLMYFNGLLENLLNEGKETIDENKFKCILYNYIKQKQKDKNYRKILKALGIKEELHSLFDLIDIFRFNKAVENIIKNNADIVLNLEKCQNNYTYQEVLFTITEFINNPKVLIKYNLFDDKLLKNLKFILNS